MGRWGEERFGGRDRWGDQDRDDRWRTEGRYGEGGRYGEAWPGREEGGSWRGRDWRDEERGGGWRAGEREGRWEELRPGEKRTYPPGRREFTGGGEYRGGEADRERGFGRESGTWRGESERGGMYGGEYGRGGMSGGRERGAYDEYQGMGRGEEGQRGAEWPGFMGGMYGGMGGGMRGGGPLSGYGRGEERERGWETDDRFGRGESRYGSSRGDQPGMFERLGDKFKEGMRKLGGGHAGPKGYRRSDERVREDVCERIARSWVESSDVEVKVQNGEVTLTGTVQRREDKRQLEDIVEDVFGVDEVHNQLRVNREATGAGALGAGTAGIGTGTTGTTTQAGQTGTQGTTQPGARPGQTPTQPGARH